MKDDYHAASLHVLRLESCWTLLTPCRELIVPDQVVAAQYLTIGLGEVRDNVSFGIGEVIFFMSAMNVATLILIRMYHSTFSWLSVFPLLRVTRCDLPKLVHV